MSVKRGTDLVLSPATSVARGTVGVVCCGEPPRWLFCEHVPNAEVAARVVDIHAGARRDRRLGATVSDNAGSVMSLGYALASFRPRELKDVTDWTHTKDPEQLWRCCGRSTTTYRGSNNRGFTQKRQCAGRTNSCVRPWSSPCSTVASM